MQMFPAQAGKRKSGWILLALFASFVLPFILGDMAYSRGWFSGGETNKGSLLTPPLAVADLALQEAGGRPVTLAGRWWIVYVVPAVCDAACQQTWLALPGMHRGLGRERDRVGVLLISSERSAAVPEVLLRMPDVRFARTSEARLVRFLRGGPAGEGAGKWYVMDPMGWFVLAYEPAATGRDSVLRAQDVLDDLQKLLKVSRIG